MKFSNLVTFLFLSHVSASKLRSRNLQSDPTDGGLYCGTVPQTKYQGIAKVVNVDNSAPSFIPTMGDVSIAEAILPVDNSDNSDISIKAMCTLTADDPSESAPFCTFESTLTLSTGAPSGISFQGKTMSMGTPPVLSIMGGTGDFMGAYGQINTLSSFSSTPVEGSTDGSINIEFDAIVEFCVPTGGDNNPPTPPPPPPCEDSKTWIHNFKNKARGCDWVGKEKSQRCRRKGQDGTTANVSCPVTCGNC